MIDAPTDIKTALVNAGINFERVSNGKIEMILIRRHEIRTDAETTLMLLLLNHPAVCAETTDAGDIRIEL